MNGSLVLILVSVVCGVCGQLSLKVGMNRIGRIGADSLSEPVQLILGVATNPMVVLGLALYAFSAVVWLTVLSRVPLSYAYPIVALAYVVTPLLAWLLLGENLPSTRWLGIAAISVGVVIVSRS